MLAFITWVKEYKVKPIAIELMLRSKTHMVATALDLYCEMEVEEKGYFGETYKSGVNKGKPKESKKSRVVKAIVDFKSGRKGFYPKHSLQLLLNKIMMEENYPGIVIEKLYNFAPKDWRGTPNYNLKEQSNAPVLDELPEILSIGRKRHLKKSKRVKVFSGTLSMKNIVNYNVESHYQNMDIEDYILQHVNKPKTPLEDLILENNIHNKIKLRQTLNKLSSPKLKGIAIEIGIRYKNKELFVKSIVEKYEKEWKKIEKKS